MVRSLFLGHCLRRNMTSTKHTSQSGWHVCSGRPLEFLSVALGVDSLKALQQHRCKIGGFILRITQACGSPCCSAPWMLVWCLRRMPLVVQATQQMRMRSTSWLLFWWLLDGELTTCVVVGDQVLWIGFH